MASHGAYCATWEKPDNKISDPILLDVSDPIFEDQIYRVFGKDSDCKAIKADLKNRLRERATKDEGMKKWLRGGGYKFGKVDQPTMSHFLNVGKKDYEDVVLKKILSACAKYCEREVESYSASRVAILVYEISEKRPDWLETGWFSALYLSLRNKGFQVMTMEYEGREQLQIHIKRAAEAIASTSSKDKCLFLYMNLHGMTQGANHLFQFDDEREDKFYSLPDVLHEAALEKQATIRDIPKFCFVETCLAENVPKRVKYVSRHSLPTNTIAVYPPPLTLANTNWGEYTLLLARHVVEAKSGETWFDSINGLAGQVVGKQPPEGDDTPQTEVETRLAFPFSFKFNE
eukprot:CAMPEP_0201522212 /NCGR_PEP_ID=MMETSP0161_2-20130828/16520_1 /ASSEMBLY_ACC=CAM_ASM_000251 /TAXON_ID=180227 /ORGANISM="Neoparamoeba aestuarina, Strain SoJaBio B1-5/56/2" /LENGTH=344 /DNA_ID=CAMNT_0047920989 /DNA_START=32 /DNA_END=1066 /DNA_ORIENTATION=+